ncbi:MAG: glycosyltransferase [Acidobacteriota bacterium]
MITILGHTDGFSGTSRHAISFALALSRREEIAWIPVDAGPRNAASGPWDRWLENGRGPVADSISIGIGAPDVMPRVRGRKRIGWVVWETTRMPQSRARHLTELDEIWTPTAWGRQVLIDSGVEPARIEVVPEGVDPTVFRPIPRDGLPAGPFRVLSVGRWEPRKGFDLLLRAWAKAFEPSDPVELVLHTSHPSDPSWRLEDALRRRNLGPHAPVVWSRPTSLPHLVLLYNRCDCFVTATRGEGWGLPVFEALACGKPVIVPRFGALAELLDDRTADFIDVARQVPAHDGRVFLRDEDCGQWAEPDPDHLVELLRNAREHPEEGEARGRRGREAVVEGWTWDHSVEIASPHLERLRSARGGRTA